MSNKIDLGALFGADEVKTFLGLDACPSLEALEAPIALLGVPCASPYKSVGPYCRNAPEAIRRSAATLAANVDRMNFDIGGPIFPDGHGRAVDCGDLPFDTLDAAANRQAIIQAVSTILGRSSVPVIIGGDDSVTVPMLRGFAGTGPYTVLQIDAHIDWRDEHMGESDGLSSVMRRASEMDHVERIIQVGARCIGSGHPDDYQAALDWGVEFVFARDFHQYGPAHVLNLIAEGSQVIVCLDVDGMDPSIVPGVIGRSPGGLTYFQMLDLIEGVATKGRLAGIGFTEFMPEADIGDLGALTVSRLIASTLAVIARQG